MLVKLYRGLFGLCVITGLIILMCTAGASDLEAIGFREIVKPGFISLLLMAFGTIGLNVTELEGRYE